MAPSSSEVQRTLMGPPWASSSTAFTYGLKNLAESCWRHFDDARKEASFRKVVFAAPVDVHSGRGRAQFELSLNFAWAVSLAFQAP